MGTHSFTISRQKDGKFCAHIVGGYITTVSNCETEQAAINNAQYAIAKNKEYAPEQKVTEG